MTEELISQWRQSDESKGRTWKTTKIRGGSYESNPNLSVFNTKVEGDVVAVVASIHAKRSPQARAADESFNAPVTTDEERWRRNPNRYDFPGVDTISGVKAAHRTAPVIVRLLKQGKLNEIEYEKRQKAGLAGQFFPHGQVKRKLKEVDLGWEGHPIKRKVYVKERSNKPEIAIYKSKYDFLKETPIERAHTVAHEAGHTVDWVSEEGRFWEQKTGHKLKQIYKEEMIGLTKHVRGGYDTSGREIHGKRYREEGTEMFADAFASFVIQPRATKRELRKMGNISLGHILEQKAVEVLGPGWRKAKAPKSKKRRKNKGDPLIDIFDIEIAI
jgi:hypothetical protein